MSIIVENLTHIYNKDMPFASKALDNVSLEIKDNDFICHEQDLISCRGKGKLKIVQFNGETKKGKEAITCVNCDYIFKEREVAALGNHNWGDWYYPYAVTYSYSTGSFLTELLNLEAPQGQTEKLPVLWTAYMSGLLSGSTSVNVNLAVQAVNQAFTQSTYLQATR